MRLLHHLLTAAFLLVMLFKGTAAAQTTADAAFTTELQAIRRDIRAAHCRIEVLEIRLTLSVERLRQAHFEQRISSLEDQLAGARGELTRAQEDEDHADDNDRERANALRLQDEARQLEASIRAKLETARREFTQSVATIKELQNVLQSVAMCSPQTPR